MSTCRGTCSAFNLISESIAWSLLNFRAGMLSKQACSIMCIFLHFLAQDVARDSIQFRHLWRASSLYSRADVFRSARLVMQTKDSQHIDCTDSSLVSRHFLLKTILMWQDLSWLETYYAVRSVRVNMSVSREYGRCVSFHMDMQILPSCVIPSGIKFWGVDSGVRHSVGGNDYGCVRTAAFMGLKIISTMAEKRKLQALKRAKSGPISPIGASSSSQIADTSTDGTFSTSSGPASDPPKAGTVLPFAHKLFVWYESALAHSDWHINSAPVAQAHSLKFEMQ